MSFFPSALTYTLFLGIIEVKLFLIPFAMFFIGLLGLLVYRQNLLVLLMAIELLLLAINLFFVLSSLWLDDITGQIFALTVLTVAAAESAIGLAIIVTIFNMLAVVNLIDLSRLKG